MAFTLNYDNMLFLDAEDLAEAGIKKAYDSLARDLGGYISPLAEVLEVVDNAAPRYVVRCGDQEYLIYSPEVPNDEGQSWGRAAYALFKIVKDQLAKRNTASMRSTAAMTWERCFLRRLSARQRGNHFRENGTGPTCRRSIIRGMASITTNPRERARQRASGKWFDTSFPSPENRIVGTIWSIA